MNDTPSGSDPQGGGRRILIVEDEALICLLLETILVEAGYDPVIASSLHDASAEIARRRPDIAILDLHLNGERVHPVAAELAAAGVPFIFATGGGSLEVEGFAGRPQIRKPFQEAELLAAIAALDG
jgi:DNA-binding response OmpR family regulator